MVPMGNWPSFGNRWLQWELNILRSNTGSDADPLLADRSIHSMPASDAVDGSHPTAS